MYTYNPSYGYNNVGIMSISTGSVVWAIIAAVLAVVGAFIIYFLFVKPSKKLDNKFLSWLRSFLDFQKMLIEPILKISYIFVALLITLESFTLIGVSFLSFLIVLIFGNIIARVVYEIGIVTISIWKNTKEINDKMKK